MTRKRKDTLHGLPVVERYHDERDKKYARCRDYAVSFLDESEIRKCMFDSAEIPKLLRKMLSDMTVGIFLKDDIRSKVFPEEIENPEQAVDFVNNGVNEARGKARNLNDFLIMSLRSRIDNNMSVDESRKHMAERLNTYIKFKHQEWKDLLTKEELTLEEEEIKFRLVNNGYNFPQLFHEFFNDLTQAELMNIFGFFLRRIGIDTAGAEVKKVLDVLLFNKFKKECDELLDIISQRRKEKKHIGRQRNETFGSIHAVVKPEEPAPAPATDPFKIETSEEERLATEEIQQATQDLLKPEEPVAEPAVREEAEGFEDKDYEDTGQINRENISSKKTIWAIRAMAGAAALAVLVSGGILYKRSQTRLSQDYKKSDPIAKGNVLETQNPPNKIIKIPNQVLQADAAVAPTPPMRPTPPPGPKRIITPPPAPNPVPPPAPIPAPVIKTNPNLKKISQLSVNDLPSHYTDQYKSLFLGQEIKLNGQSMSGYIENAIKEVSSPRQWKNFNKYLNRKMKPGWSMYMASLNDAWFENVYKKKYRGWYNKGKRDLKKYEKLKKRLELGKKLSSRQERLLKYYEEQMRVGKLTMLSLGALNMGKDVNNLNSGKYSDENGNVASIVMEMAEAADLRLPEIITADLETASPKHPEVQLADFVPDQKSIKAGQDLLKRVNQIEAQQAAQAEVRGIAMENAVDNVLAKLSDRQTERERIMENVVNKMLRNLEPSTDDEYYASIEIQKPPVKDEESEDYYLSYEIDQSAKVDDPVDDYYKLIEIEKPDTAEVKAAETDADYYAEITAEYSDENYAQVEITKNDEAEIDNYYASVEIEESAHEKPKGIFGKVKSWFSRKAA